MAKPRRNAKRGSSSAKKFQHSQAQRTKTVQAENKFLTQIEIEDEYCDSAAKQRACWESVHPGKSTASGAAP
jgi:hypothetical protein